MISTPKKKLKLLERIDLNLDLQVKMIRFPLEDVDIPTASSVVEITFKRSHSASNTVRRMGSTLLNRNLKKFRLKLSASIGLMENGEYKELSRISAPLCVQQISIPTYVISIQDSITRLEYKISDKEKEEDPDAEPITLFSFIDLKDLIDLEDVALTLPMLMEVIQEGEASSKHKNELGDDVICRPFEGAHVNLIISARSERRRNPTMASINYFESAKNESSDAKNEEVNDRGTSSTPSDTVGNSENIITPSYGETSVMEGDVSYSSSNPPESLEPHESHGFSDVPFDDRVSALPAEENRYQEIVTSTPLEAHESHGFSDVPFDDGVSALPAEENRYHEIITSTPSESEVVFSTENEESQLEPETKPKHLSYEIEIPTLDTQENAVDDVPMTPPPPPTESPIDRSLLSVEEKKKYFHMRIEEQTAGRLYRAPSQTPTYARTKVDVVEEETQLSVSEVIAAVKATKKIEKWVKKDGFERVGTVPHRVVELEMKINTKEGAAIPPVSLKHTSRSSTPNK